MKKRKTPDLLAKIRQEPRMIQLEISCWCDFLANADLMKVILLQLHLFDVINLARTCRRLYRFYFGKSKLDDLLCDLVHKCTGARYQSLALKCLGTTRNVQSFKDGDETFYGAQKCAGCFKTARSRGFWSAEPTKYIHCKRCRYLESLFYQNIYPYVIRLAQDKYASSEKSRIHRVVSRYAIVYGLAVEKLLQRLLRLNTSCDAEVCNTFLFLKGDYLMAELDNLDILPKVVIRPRVIEATDWVMVIEPADRTLKRSRSDDWFSDEAVDNQNLIEIETIAKRYAADALDVYGELEDWKVLEGCL